MYASHGSALNDPPWLIVQSRLRAQSCRADADKKPKGKPDEQEGTT